MESAESTSASSLLHPSRSVAHLSADVSSSSSSLAAPPPPPPPFSRAQICRRRTKSPTHDSIETRGNLWRCVCGSISSTSTAFFVHSRVCSARKGGTPLESSATVTPSTVRGQMFSSLCAVVSTGELQGDSLAAAVQVIQLCAAEEARSKETWELLPVFLPVSGTTLLAAARHSGQKGVNVERNGGDGEDEDDDAEQSPPTLPYYTVLPDGLRNVARSRITHTYRHRAAFAVLDDNSDDEENGGDGGGDEERNTVFLENAGSVAVELTDDTSSQRCLPKLRFNAAHSDMSSYVYKRFLPRDDHRSERDDEEAGSLNSAACSAKKRVDPLCMDLVLQQEREQIARVPMPAVEWRYLK